MKDFKTLRQYAKKKDGLKEVQVALLGDTATQFLATAIIGEGAARGYKISLFEAEYNQIERQLYDQSSDYYDCSPKYTIVFQSAHKLLEKYNLQSYDERFALADERIEFIKSLCEMLKGPVIYLNYPEIDDCVFGSYSNKYDGSFIYQLRKINFELMNLAQQYSNLFICDIAALQSKFGRDYLFDPSIYVSTDMVLSMRSLPYISSRIVDIIAAIEGSVKKCLILDLDNTIWGGVVGDDGWEKIQIGHDLGMGKIFVEFQEWIKKLKDRGVIICVCSKNDEEKAKEPFEKNPEMILRLEDISVFVANWDNKPDNIRFIQSVLNIGFDSMVFIDDNAFERNIVRKNLPDVTVPELPDSPELYLEYLYAENLFETASFSSNDKDRTKQYQDQAKRVANARRFTNESDYLKSLQMISKVESFTDYNTPRVAQLSQRSNQFNLRTVRYTEDQIIEIQKDPHSKGFAFTLDDQFGSNGLIAVVILKECYADNQEIPQSVRTIRNAVFIDTWFMSCRVMKRGMESFTLNTIVAWAKDNGYRRIIGEYLPTQKNGIVKNHYEELGFSKLIGAETSQWELIVDDYQTKETFIQQ